MQNQYTRYLARHWQIRRLGDLRKQAATKAARQLKLPGQAAAHLEAKKRGAPVPATAPPSTVRSAPLRGASAAASGWLRTHCWPGCAWKLLVPAVQLCVLLGATPCTQLAPAAMQGRPYQSVVTGEFT